MHCVLNLWFRCKFCKNEFFNTFFPLSIHAILKLASVLLQKIGKNVFGGQFLQLYCKNESGRNFHFLFDVFIRTALPFNEKKIGTNLCSVFLAILLNCTDWAITCRIARVQFNSTLERKVKTRALKGIFLVHKRTNITWKSNSAWYNMHHRKNFSFLSTLGCARFLSKGPK